MAYHRKRTRNNRKHKKSHGRRRMMKRGGAKGLTVQPMLLTQGKTGNAMMNAHLRVQDMNDAQNDMNQGNHGGEQSGGAKLLNPTFVTGMPPSPMDATNTSFKANSHSLQQQEYAKYDGQLNEVVPASQFGSGRKRRRNTRKVRRSRKHKKSQGRRRKHRTRGRSGKK